MLRTPALILFGPSYFVYNPVEVLWYTLIVCKSMVKMFLFACYLFELSSFSDLEYVAEKESFPSTLTEIRIGVLYYLLFLLLCESMAKKDTLSEGEEW